MFHGLRSFPVAAWARPRGRRRAIRAVDPAMLSRCPCGDSGPTPRPRSGNGRAWGRAWEPAWKCPWNRTAGRAGGVSGLQLRLLGPLTISRDGVAAGAAGVAQGARALAYLSLAPHAVARSQLCELLWDVPNDPRGELRWCLSKLSGILDEPGRQRVDTQRRHHQARPCGLLRRCDRGRPRGPGGHRDARRPSGCGRSPRCSPAIFSKGWRSTATRPSTAGSSRSGAGSAAATPRCWSISSAASRTTRPSAIWTSGCELAPFDQRVHEMLLNALARRGRIREGEEHLAATVRLFEAEGLDCAPIREAWRAAPGAGRRRARDPAAARRCRGRRRQPTAPSRGSRRRASIAVMPFVDRAAAHGGPRRRRRRARPRRDHAARQAAQPVRHRAGHRVRAARAAASARKRPAGC